MNKVFGHKFSLLQDCVIAIAEIFVKRKRTTGNVCENTAKAGLFLILFQSTMAMASPTVATNVTENQINQTTYSLVDLATVGTTLNNLIALDSTPNMNFSNLSGGGVNTCGSVSCSISTGNSNTNIPFQVLQAPATPVIGATGKIGGVFLQGGTSYGSYLNAQPTSYNIDLSNATTTTVQGTTQTTSGLLGQKSFYALVNTWWGSQSTANEFTITVNFKDNNGNLSQQTFTNLSGVDVRDFNYNPNTSQTVSNSTQGWYVNGTQRLDVRSFSIAPENWNKTIVGVSLSQIDTQNAAGILSGLTFSPNVLVPANDITTSYNNLYNLVRTNGSVTGRSATLYNNMNDVMVNVSNKFDGGTLSNNQNGNTSQNFVVTNNGGFINASGNQLSFNGNFSNDGSVTNQNPAGKMIIQSLDQQSGTDYTYYDNHTGNTVLSNGKVVLTGDNSNFSGGFLVKDGATLEINNSQALGTGDLNLVGTANTPVTLSSTANLSINNNITVNGDPIFNITNGTTTTINGNITDGTVLSTGSSLPGDVVVAGGGTLELKGNNTYTGGTEIQSGTLKLSDNGVLGGGNYTQNIANQGTIDFSASADQVISGNITGTGNLIKNGTGTLSLAGNNSYTGDTNINLGVLNLNGTLDSPNINVNGGTLNNNSGGINTNSTINLTSGNVNINENQTIQSLNGQGGTVNLANSKSLSLTNDSTFNGIISGEGALHINGGTTELTGNNTYVGTTQLNAGSLNLLGTLASTVININGGTLNDVNAGLSSNTTLNIDSGHANIQANQSIASLNGNGGEVNISTNKTLALTNNGNYAGVISGNGNLNINGGNTTLSGSNSYTGNTNINSGVLNLTGTLASTIVNVQGGELNVVNSGLSTNSNLTINNGQANIQSTQDIHTLNGNGGILSIDSAKTLSVNGNGSYSGAIQGAGTLEVKQGEQLLTGNNTHTGGIKVDAGAVLTINNEQNLGTGLINLAGAANNTATLKILNNSTIDNAIQVSLDPTFNISQGTTTNINSVISDGASAGDVVVTGGGTLALNNNNTYSGKTSIDNGTTLTLNNNGQISNTALLTNNGVFNIVPKNSNTVINGNYVQNTSGALNMKLTPTNNPQLLIGGTAVLAGTLNLAATQGSYNAGRYNLINATNGVSGKFSTANISGISLAYLLGYDQNNVYLSILPVSVNATAQTVQANANNISSLYNQQAAVYQAAFSYDCQVYDEHNLCVSVGGRYTYAGPSSANSQAGVVILGYKPSPTWRVGAFADQSVNISTPNGFTQSKNSPTWGLFAKWHQNKDETGWGIQASAVTSDSSLNITRAAMTNAEQGTGTTQFNGQGFQLSTNYHHAITDSTSLVPYIGLRYTKINAGAYTENYSSNVTYPLSYNAMAQNTFAAIGGIGVKSHLAEKTTGTVSVGLQQNLNYSMSNYQGSSNIPGYQTFNAALPGNTNSMATASAGIYYDVKKNERLGFNVLWQQQPFINTNTTTALATYTIGF